MVHRLKGSEIFMFFFYRTMNPLSSPLFAQEFVTTSELREPERKFIGLLMRRIGLFSDFAAACRALHQQQYTFPLTLVSRQTRLFLCGMQIPKPNVPVSMLAIKFKIHEWPCSVRSHRIRPITALPRPGLYQETRRASRPR